MKQALLALEDGTVFWGKPFGARGETFGEVVFNTNLTGYQEVLTDPSYKGQIVTMTYPLIGNYGINDADLESLRPQVEGFIVKEGSKRASNWRAQYTLEEWLQQPWRRRHPGHRYPGAHPSSADAWGHAWGDCHHRSRPRQFDRQSSSVARLDRARSGLRSDVRRTVHLDRWRMALAGGAMPRLSPIPVSGFASWPMISA